MKTLNKHFAARIAEFMKVSKKSETEVYLSDGIMFWLDSRMFGDSIYYPGTLYLGNIYVDIDGPGKGKNEPGKDII